ncbi:MAG: TRAP transporter fused permease subunit [Deltaproteobacteria bacterium]|nr:TRAP transporter fused permease subunit [Deltaproteobacteria bacterium]
MDSVWKKHTIVFFSMALGFFTLYTGAAGALVAPVQRGIHLMLIIPVMFLLKGSKVLQGRAEMVLNLILIAAGMAAMGWYILAWERLYADPNLATTDLLMGIIGIVVVIEATRRLAGTGITVLIIIFILYALFGRQIPFDFLAHRGFTPSELVYMIFYGTEGIFSTPIAVCATFIILIVMFGGFLTVSGASDFFMNIAQSVAGGYRGGPAKIAVIASGLLGMITGASVANVATTGSVTIPMMKRMGFQPHYAGAVEALASSGSQIMPPIMGAAVFIMVEYVMIPYLKVCIYSLPAALLFFLAVFLAVHFHAVKEGMQGIPQELRPSFWEEIKRNGHLVISIVLLLYLLSEWMAPMFAITLVIGAHIVISWLRPATRIGPKRFVEGTVQGIKAMAPLTAVCAGAGIIIGILCMTGMGMRLSFLIEYLSQGNLLLALFFTAVACLILGMGLPTVAAYVVLASIVPPVLKKMGVDVFPAHMFIFYFAILAGITPPVCTAAYCAAGIADSNPMKTGLTATRLGFVCFLLPFAFVYDPAILGQGTPSEIAIAIFFTTASVLFWAAFVEGFFFLGKLNIIQQILMGVCSLALIHPSYLVSSTGLVAALITLFVPKLLSSKRS